jgi:hypothetical protein
MSESKGKVTNMKIKKVDDSQNVGKEAEEILNSIKDHKINEGIIPRTTTKIRIQDFAGKVLCRSKSIYMGGVQYFVKAGTKWEDVDKFARKNIAFTEADFE